MIQHNTVQGSSPHTGMPGPFYIGTEILHCWSCHRACSSGL
jgi:hypothetical protein